MLPHEQGEIMVKRKSNFCARALQGCAACCVVARASVDFSDYGSGPILPVHVSQHMPVNYACCMSTARTTGGGSKPRPSAAAAQ